MTLGRSLELALLAGHAQWCLDHGHGPRMAAAARRFALERRRSDRRRAARRHASCSRSAGDARAHAENANRRTASVRRWRTSRSALSSPGRRRQPAAGGGGGPPRATRRRAGRRRRRATARHCTGSGRATRSRCACSSGPWWSSRSTSGGRCATSSSPRRVLAREGVGADGLLALLRDRVVVRAAVRGHLVVGLLHRLAAIALQLDDATGLRALDDRALPQAAKSHEQSN